VINPLREPGLERYWVPSSPESAVFGTKMTDEFFAPHTGGDVAFLNGVLKVLIEDGGVDERFVRDGQDLVTGERPSVFEERGFGLVECARSCGHGASDYLDGRFRFAA